MMSDWQALAKSQTDGDEGIAAIHASSNATEGKCCVHRGSDMTVLQSHDVSSTYRSTAAAAALRSSQRCHAKGAKTGAAIWI